MLENMMILAKQILVMLLLMGVGYVCFRLGYIDNKGAGQLSTVLNRIVAPSVIIHSFQREFDPALVTALLCSVGCALLYFGIAIVAAHLCFRPQTVGKADKRFASVFTNCGFMSLPLLEALFGSYGLFLGSAFIIVNNILLWSYGVSQLTTNVTSAQRLRSIVWNPGTVSLAIGLIFFLTPLTLPSAPAQAVSYLASLNTPLAMLILGVFLAQCDLRACFLDRGVYQVTALSLLLLPLFCMGLYRLLPIEETVRAAMLVCVSAPVAMASPMFAQVYGTDYLFSTRAVAVSTLLSVVTIPVMNALLTLLQGG